MAINNICGMLASVRSLAEAKQAVAADVDIIDMKEPNQGVLGNLPIADVKAIVHSLPKAIKSSATIGDLPPTHTALAEHISAMSKTGLSYVKVGLFSPQIDLSFIQTLKAHSNIIIVLFAEYYAAYQQDKATFDKLLGSGICGMMLDTMNKDGLGLCDLITQQDIKTFIERCNHAGIIHGLAGSLTLTDIPILLTQKPNYLGFRGALCTDGRNSMLDQTRLSIVRQAIPKHEDISMSI